MSMADDAAVNAALASAFSCVSSAVAIAIGVAQEKVAAIGYSYWSLQKPAGRV